MNLLQSLIVASEKAANIARLCRQDEHLFDLLVQEKPSDESNPRFVQDFKTLADVLIQETVKHDVGEMFSEMKSFIFGEEDNTFENKLGERIKVEIMDTEDGTRVLLQKVLNGDEKAAQLLAENVHMKIKIEDVNTNFEIPQCDNCENLSIWIDPIDSTAEYINGVDRKNKNGVYISGLRCVTVLLGVFDRISGKPIMGIINQPFFKNVDKKWTGRCFWSFHGLSSIDNIPPATNTVCLSSSEDSKIRARLKSSGYDLVEAAGAGYKMLLVILGTVDVYLLSKSSTYKWDTCGPQSLLESQNGGLVVYKNAIEGDLLSVNYKLEESATKSKIESSCNNGGIVAFRDKDAVYKVLEILRN